MRFFLMLLASLALSSAALADLSQYSNTELLNEIARRLDGGDSSPGGGTMVKIELYRSRNCDNSYVLTLSIDPSRSPDQVVQACQNVARLNGNPYIAGVKSPGGDCRDVRNGGNTILMSEYCDRIFP